MVAINVTELNHGITKVNGTNITIEIGSDSITVKSYGVPIETVRIRERKDNEMIAYVGAWFDCIAILPNLGTTADIEPIIGFTRFKALDAATFDVRNCVGCGAYRRATGIDILMEYYSIDRETAEKLLS